MISPANSCWRCTTQNICIGSASAIVIYSQSILVGSMGYRWNVERSGRKRPKEFTKSVNTIKNNVMAKDEGPGQKLALIHSFKNQNLARLTSVEKPGVFSLCSLLVCLHCWNMSSKFSNLWKVFVSKHSNQAWAKR